MQVLIAVDGVVRGKEVAALQYPPAAASAVIMVIIVTLMVAGILRLVDVRKELAR